MTERAERELPFEIEADGMIVLIHRFRPDLDRTSRAGGSERCRSSKRPSGRGSTRATPGSCSTSAPSIRGMSTRSSSGVPCSELSAVCDSKTRGGSPATPEATREAFRQANRDRRRRAGAVPGTPNHALPRGTRDLRDDRASPFRLDPGTTRRSRDDDVPVAWGRREGIGRRRIAIVSIERSLDNATGPRR